MSFIDSAAELLDRTEASLNSLITEALKAKAYKEIATIAGMAESVAAIGPGRAREGKRVATSTADVGIATPEPSWMKSKT